MCMNCTCKDGETKEKTDIKANWSNRINYMNSFLNENMSNTPLDLLGFLSVVHNNLIEMHNELMMEVLTELYNLKGEDLSNYLRTTTLKHQERLLKQLLEVMGDENSSENCENPEQINDD